MQRTGCTVRFAPVRLPLMRTSLGAPEIMKSLVLLLLLTPSAFAAPPPSAEPEVILYWLQLLPEPTPPAGITPQRFCGALVRGAQKLALPDAAAFQRLLRAPDLTIPASLPTGTLACVDPVYGLSVRDSGVLHQYIVSLRCRRLDPSPYTEPSPRIRLTALGSNALAPFFCRAFPEEPHACRIPEKTDAP
jgi:hypothetical protein